MGEYTEPCTKCTREISTDASVCPECGYDPQSKGRLARRIFYIVGVVCTVSIIAAPIGIPILLFYYFAEKQVSKKTPTAV